MPKEQISISRFEGGLVNALDDRDLPENSVSEIQNLRVDKLGQLALIPPAEVYERFNADAFGGWESDGFAPHYGLHSFSADRAIQKEYIATTFATAESGAATTVTLRLLHDICVGDMVRIVGTFDSGLDGGDYDGYFRVKACGVTTLVIDKTFGDGHTNQTASVTRMATPSDTNHNFLIMQDKYQFNVYDGIGMRFAVIKLQDSFGQALGGSQGSSHNYQLRPAFFDIDGIARVSDGRFKNTLHKYPRWFGYIPPRPIGDYQDLRGATETNFNAFSNLGDEQISVANDSTFGGSGNWANGASAAAFDTFTVGSGVLTLANLDNDSAS